MIVYSSTKEKFQNDVMTNDIGNIIYKTYQNATGKETGKSEINSWVNSLQYMDRVLNDTDIPYDVGVAIEYHIPQSSKRIDFILTGADEDKNETAVLIELKQWQKAYLTKIDGVVVTRFQHGDQQTPHPSYQAWTYKRLLEDYNQTIQEEKIQLFPCAYLHNYLEDGVINNDFYREYFEQAPIFLKKDALKLQNFIKKNIRYGDKNRIMYRIDQGKIKPSKNLADQLTSMLKGNEEFLMIDDQKIIYETAISLALTSSEKNKNVLIVEGGPGTGKTVVAINLLVELTKRGLVAQYVTRNSAPRLVYETKLTGSFKKSYISNMFSGSGSYHSVEKNTYACLIVDEAHRLNAKSGMFSHLGENQIKEVIRSANFAIFFIDEDQKITLKDIGDKEEINKHAMQMGAKVTELVLESQFRCNGSNGYLSWIDNSLGIRETANDTFDSIDYDFRIMDDPRQLHDLIKKKNMKNNKARVVAGYCWDWISKKNPALKDIKIGNYEATWNLDSDGQAWIIQPDSVNEIGCIHTCQGLEVDYIGVIVGPDLIVRNGSVITQPKERAKTDKSIHGLKTLLKENPVDAARRVDAIIKNTYRTLMTRGQKGCYVYFTDPETKAYFKRKIHAPSNELIPYKNALPLLNLRAVANSSYENLDGYFTNNENYTWHRVTNDVYAKDRFLVRATGNSMEPKISDGDLCLFRKDPGGSRNGKIVLCRIDGFAGEDPIALIKRYQSARITGADNPGEATAIVLSSFNSVHEDIVLTNGENFSILGIFEQVISASDNE